MGEMKYPIGVQTFSEIIEEGYCYVDKTGFIPKLVNEGKYYFLSRPRRFGKSLLLSTLEAYFEGRKELFKGLALGGMDVDWTPSPVLYFDFNSEDYSVEDGLRRKLDRILSEFEMKYNINWKDDTLTGRFERLIKQVNLMTHRKVVILVDEYDKPLLGIEENAELYRKNQALMKGFYGNLKSMDSHIRFALLTGVARFNKVSIFSDLNNLRDISLSNEYADICGWTEEEMIGNFLPGITELAATRRESVGQTIETLRSYYDGYKFGERGSRLYNPFSVLIALCEKKIRPYWFDTGTPDFLARRVRKYGLPVESFNGMVATDSDLLAVEMNTGNPAGLMFQTGYLTIDTYDEARNRYRLRFPNREVEIGFADLLYPLYVHNGERPDSPFNLNKFQDDLFEDSPERFMERLQTLIKDLPYEMHNENNYRSIVWLLCTLCSMDVTAEPHSYKGRSDLEVKTPDYVYVFEFKYNGSAHQAMDQLKERDYAGWYALDGRTVYLVGANFCTQKERRGLTEWIIERVFAGND